MRSVHEHDVIRRRSVSLLMSMLLLLLSNVLLLVMKMEMVFRIVQIQTVVVMVLVLKFVETIQKQVAKSVMMEIRLPEMVVVLLVLMKCLVVRI